MNDPKPREMEAYLSETFFCDFPSPSVRTLAEKVDGAGKTPVDLAKAAFLLVRDQILFGFDLWQVKASATVQKGYGMCSNKALVLVAVLRHCRVPARLACVRMKREGLNPAWGGMGRMMSRELNHVIAEVHLQGEWIPVDLTLDKRTYERLFIPAGITWGIDWDASSPCLLFKEHLVGPVVSYRDVDEALRENAGNSAPPRRLGEAMMGFLNKRMWPRARG